ncbi:uncharacterized protein L3040_003290 [Drepanopeziza brunnea f. sp. 'multigermtubi']|uniref:uncharacterized protein n=1 Tax=Drepanopeziza brunnea f. sp. 'multigermtubi' TaxID=698441 RepID=UPI00239F1B2C|nr:hypothetical protein L3040_003290 [Drepanopeziza brunnea f. sp. 'multigermtubi']
MQFWKLCCSIITLASTARSQAAPTPASFEGQLSHVNRRASRLEARTGMQLRILPVGASIVFGTGSTDGNGFRLGLKTALMSYGNDVQMLGTQHGGNMTDNNCDCWPGNRTDEVAAKVQAGMSSISPKPNVVLIHVGSNDLRQKKDPAVMGENLSNFLDYLYQTLPAALIVVSTLLPNSAIEAGAVVYNANVRSIVDAQSRLGRNVYLADVHIPELTPSDMFDYVHPNDIGYAKIAGIYARKIQEVIGKLVPRASAVNPPSSTLSSSTPASVYPSTVTSYTFSQTAILGVPSGTYTEPSPTPNPSPTAEPTYAMGSGNGTLSMVNVTSTALPNPVQYVAKGGSTSLYQRLSPLERFLVQLVGMTMAYAIAL